MIREVRETIGNDSFGQATPLGRAENDSFVNGSLTGTDQVDVYKFTVDRPTKFAAGMSMKGVDADLALFNSQGQMIKFSSNVGTSAIENINVDNLPVGDYFLSVRKFSGDGTYSLTTNGDAIARAQLSVTIDRVTALERFDTPIPFTNFERADFFIETNIEGKKKNSRVFGNDNDINPNFTVNQDVDINKQIISATIGVKDEDPDLDDVADINPGLKEAISFRFDSIKGQVQSDGTLGSGISAPFPEGQIITLEGDGDVLFPIPIINTPNKGARIQFRVNYETFTSSFSPINGTTPIIRGNGGSQTLIGQNQSGILCGEGGNDDLSGMGGNDILCGGAGNDKLDGGIGADISFGGKGRDTHNGSASRDTFVLEPNSGVDVIRNFQDGVDKLGLAMGMGFEMLDIIQQGKNTVIGTGSQQFAMLSNVKADQITGADFVTVDFIDFRGVEVPTIIS